MQRLQGNTKKTLREVISFSFHRKPNLESFPKTMTLVEVKIEIKMFI